MNSGYLSSYSQTRNGVPFFGLMALVGLVGFIYYNYVHKNGKDDKGFHGIMKKYVVPITILVVLGTLILSNFSISAAPAVSTTSATNSTSTSVQTPTNSTTSTTPGTL